MNSVKEAERSNQQSFIWKTRKRRKLKSNVIVLERTEEVEGFHFSQPATKQRANDYHKQIKNQ